jgi:hypothetical protein
MAKINTHSAPYLKSLNDIFNKSFDGDFDVLLVENLGYDGTGLQRPLSDSMNYKVVSDGAVTYVGCAAPGTAQATAKWQVFKIDTSSGTVLTYADDNSNFDNTVTDMSALF